MALKQDALPLHRNCVINVFTFGYIVLSGYYQEATTEFFELSSETIQHLTATGIMIQALLGLLLHRFVLKNHFENHKMNSALYIRCW
ncbi:MAG: hypothetical protein DSZ28_04530 [Thiothrix sp.]|nr:MAG: hypothetical protein DSZ28_04530 [Thiothrix sp.]